MEEILFLNQIKPSTPEMMFGVVRPQGLRGKGSALLSYHQLDNRVRSVSSLDLCLFRRNWYREELGLEGGLREIQHS